MSTSVVVGVLASGAVLGVSVRARRPARVDDLCRPLDQYRRRRRSTSDLRRDPRVQLLAVTVVVLLLVLHPWLPVVTVAVVSSARPFTERRTARRRAAEIRAQLPDVIDLLRSSLDAGLTIGRAVDAVAVRCDGAWKEALAEVRRRVALGDRLAVALHALDELGDPARPLLRALISSERDGAPLTLALDALARDARLERRRDAEERARRLPVQLLFPLVLCILPAFGLLTIVPLLAGTFRSLTS